MAIRISVIVPCYNAEPYLAQTLGSALDQDCQPHEIIVIDDGSSDQSLSIARRFEAVHPDRVRVHAQRFGQAARTRNFGASLASGDALMFLDADDVIRPDTLGALATALTQEPGSVAICPWFRLVLHDGRWVARPPSCVPRMEGQDPLDAWLTGWYHPPCSVLWSRDAFEAIGSWDEQAGSNDDGDLMMRALVKGTALLETQGGAGYYRRRADGEASLSARRFTRANLSGRLRTVRKIACLLEQSGRTAGHRAALSTAFRLVAADAASEHTDLFRQASALARSYRPSPIQRIKARLAPASQPASRPRSNPVVTADVRFGQARAEAVLAAPTVPGSPEPGSAPPPAPPTVSVVVPTFNRASLLPRAIDSVLAQTFTDFELLVVDDASTDETAEVVRRYADPRVRYLVQPHNTGVAGARNRGMRAARGDFIAFLDSDDEWMPEKLERQIGLLRGTSPSVGLVYSGVESVREGGVPTIEPAGARGDIYREMLHRNVIHGGGSNVVMRRQVIATAGFFHEGLPAIEDYEYWLRITRFFEVDAIDEPLVRYHDRGGAERRSRALRANLEARGWLFSRYARDMRRARVAHLFLLRDVRRALRAPAPDYRTARRLALRALMEAPFSRTALASFVGTSIQGASQWRWVRRHAALG